MRVTMNRKGTITVSPDTDAEMVICTPNAANAASAKEAQ